MKKLLTFCKAVCMALLLLLSACGGEDVPGGASQPSDASQAAAPAVNPASSSAPAEWETLRFGAEAPGPEGCYIRQYRPEGNGMHAMNILYADYATGQLVYLCNRPECTHADETCTSYRASGAALAFYGGRVYTLDQHGDAPSISVCDTDGANAKILVSPESGSSLSRDAFVTDGEALYTVGVSYIEEEDGSRLTSGLLRIDLASGAKTALNETDYGNAFLLSGVGNEVVLYTVTMPESEFGYYAAEQTIIGVDRTTGAERVIYTVSEGAEIVDQNGFAFHIGAPSGTAYVLRMDDGAIDAVNLATGAVQTTTFDNDIFTRIVHEVDMTGMSQEEVEYRLAHPPRSHSIYGIFDGNLVLVCGESKESGDIELATYAIGLSTGEIRRITLTSSVEAFDGDPIVLKDEVGDDFFVHRDYMVSLFPGIGPEGEPRDTVTTTHQYALISKADYYASNPNYRDFVLL